MLQRFILYFHFREISICDMEECLENIHNCLDDIWKIEEIEYPQNRMKHLFEVIGNEIIKLVQRTSSNMNIWSGNNNENIDILRICKKNCNKCTKTCEQLTTLYWPNYSYHKWVDSKYSPENLISFSNHIDEVRIVNNI